MSRRIKVDDIHPKTIPPTKRSDVFILAKSFGKFVLALPYKSAKRCWFLGFKQQDLGIELIDRLWRQRITGKHDLRVQALEVAS